MSNIYIQEPPTSGKVLLKTSVGDIDIELWAKECPKACRNFIQLCLEGYYDGTIFHRVVKDFIVQGGDPCGDGTGGESIYGQPFKDEFHSRLRYTRRGLLGMANSGKDDNASQFFFTLGATPELQNQNTLFGKVTGDTIYNMLKLQEGLVDHSERPMYAQRIIRTEILNNPFDDIKPRVLPKAEKKEKRQKREKGVKNFGLLSFGEEAEGDEMETNDFVHKNAGKAKSLHDVADDPKLSKEVLKINSSKYSGEETELAGDNSINVKEEDSDAEERRDRIKRKLKAKLTGRESTKGKSAVKAEISDSEEDTLMTQELQRRLQSEKKKEEIRKEILTLKKQYQTDKKIKDELLEKKTEDSKPEKDLSKQAEKNELIHDFIEVKQKYSSMKTKLPKKGTNREDFTLSILSKFRAKLDNLRQKQFEDSNSTAVVSLDDSVVEKEIQGDDWLAHTLKFEETAPIVAKDASTKGDDWYDAYDPRNPLNKRKRGEGSKSSRHSESSTKRKR